jgi:arsenite methyltransferase
MATVIHAAGTPKAPPRKGSYGIDAPWLLPIPISLLLYNLATGVARRSPWPLVAAGLIAVCLGLGWHSSRRGKFVVWGELLDDLGLRGDERVLDLGCGRGAVLLLAARRLDRGKAIGVDLWRGRDQSGNALESTRRNAVAEGVANRVELHTADMTALPFPEESFDVVVSNIALHNLPDRAGRDRALAEAARVLRPGGRLLLADLRFTGEYVEILRRLGLTEISRRNLGWRVWWSGPWLPTHLVSARKK